MPDQTPTVFRVWPNGEVIALFPATAAGSQYGDCICYQHFGQHGSADYGHVVRTTRPAKPEEYADLLAELTTVGYDPKVYRRQQPEHHRNRMDEHHRLARGG
jgi:hypothetical protein